MDSRTWARLARCKTFIASGDGLFFSSFFSVIFSDDRLRPVNGGPHATRSVQDRTLSLRANPAVVDVEKQQAKQRVHREEPESRGGRVDTGEYQ